MGSRSPSPRRSKSPMEYSRSPERRSGSPSPLPASRSPREDRSYSRSAGKNSPRRSDSRDRSYSKGRRFVSLNSVHVLAGYAIIKLSSDCLLFALLPTPCSYSLDRSLSSFDILTAGGRAALESTADSKARDRDDWGVEYLEISDSDAAFILGKGGFCFYKA